MSKLKIVAILFFCLFQNYYVNAKETYQQTYKIRIQTYWYNPQLGGINCNHECNYLGADGGYLTEDWYQKSLACPVDFPRKTIFIIRGFKNRLADGDWVCLDTGNKITIENGTVKVDLLSKYPVWNEKLDIDIIFPKNVSKIQIRELFIIIKENRLDNN